MANEVRFILYFAVALVLTLLLSRLSHRVSPYRFANARMLRLWERLLLVLIAIYPSLPLLALFTPWVDVQHTSLQRALFLIIAHALLSLFSVEAARTLVRISGWYRILFGYSVFFGSIYMYFFLLWLIGDVL